MLLSCGTERVWAGCSLCSPCSRTHSDPALKPSSSDVSVALTPLGAHSDLIVSAPCSDPSLHAGADLAAKRRLTPILTGAQSVTATAGKSTRRSSTRSPLEEKRAT